MSTPSLQIQPVVAKLGKDKTGRSNQYLERVASEIEEAGTQLGGKIESQRDGTRSASSPAGLTIVVSCSWVKPNRGSASSRRRTYGRVEGDLPQEDWDPSPCPWMWVDPLRRVPWEGIPSRDAPVVLVTAGRIG
jgi:hypothetical protein